MASITAKLNPRAVDDGISARLDKYVQGGIAVWFGCSLLSLTPEEAAQLHEALGGVLEQLRAANDEGPTAPAGVAA